RRESTQPLITLTDDGSALPGMSAAPGVVELDEPPPQPAIAAARTRVANGINAVRRRDMGHWMIARLAPLPTMSEHMFDDPVHPRPPLLAPRGDEGQPGAADAPGGARPRAGGWAVDR